MFVPGEPLLSTALNAGPSLFDVINGEIITQEPAQDVPGNAARVAWPSNRAFADRRGPPES